MSLNSTELAGLGRLVAEESLQIKEGDEILVLTDTRISEYLGTEALIESIMSGITAAGGQPVLMTYLPTMCDGGDVPELVAKAMLSAKAVVTVPSFGLTHTPATTDAMRAGTSFLMMPCGCDLGTRSDQIFRLLPRTKKEMQELATLTRKAGDLFRNGKNVHLTTKLGSDLTLNVGDLGMFCCTGVIDKPGMLQYYPTGQLAVGVTPGTANGKFVIDGSIWPLPNPLAQPITFIVKDGYVTDIQGGAEAAAYRPFIEAIGEKDAYNIAEIGIGTNPRAQIVGDPLEDERYYGSGHIGIGANRTFGGDIEPKGWHSDAIMRDATIEIDGKLIMEDGRFLI